MTRVVCANTLSAALSERTRAKLTIRHTKNAPERLEGVQEALAGIRGDLMTVEEKLTFLATRRVTRESMEGILDRLFPKAKDEDGAEKESSTRRKNVLAEVLALYEHNDGNAFPEQRGTAYALLNAVTNYTDHLRSSRGANGTGRAESAIFGSGERLKAQALEIITQSANGMPTMLTTTAVWTPKPVGSERGSLLDQVIAESAG